MEGITAVAACKSFFFVVTEMWFYHLCHRWGKSPHLSLFTACRRTNSFRYKNCFFSLIFMVVIFFALVLDRGNRPNWVIFWSYIWNCKFCHRTYSGVIFSPQSSMERFTELATGIIFWPYLWELDFFAALIKVRHRLRESKKKEEIFFTAISVIYLSRSDVLHHTYLNIAFLFLTTCLMFWMTLQSEKWF